MSSAASARRTSALQAVICDLDGTLVDSLPGIHAAVAATLAPWGIPDPGMDAVRSMIGEGAQRLLDRAFSTGGRDCPPGAVDAWLGHYQRTEPVGSAPRAGADDLLRVLHIGGLRLGLCTNKPQEPADGLVGRLGWTGRFRSVVGARSTLARKPAPDPVRLVLSELDCDPEHAIFVGDSPTDAEAAARAGVRLVLIRGGYSRTPIDGLGADAVIDHLADLPAVLARLFPQENSARP